MTYPILLDVRDKRIVIVGGGAVALRKAKKLAEAGANNLTAIAPRFAPGFPRNVRKITATFRPAHLANATLVFAATDSIAVNAAVAKAARKRNALLSRADDEDGDFKSGAAMQEGNITLCVWSESPALSAAVRDKLKERWDSNWSKMSRAMQTLRPMILKSGLSPQKRQSLLRDLACEAAMSKLAASGIKGLREWTKLKIWELSAKET
jgi:precorrin-2 dehydrogenase/sirohydrochlorin ferrochelatase